MVYGTSHLAGVDFKEDIVLCEVPFGGVLFLNNLIPHRRFVSSLFSLFDLSFLSSSLLLLFFFSYSFSSHSHPSFYFLFFFFFSLSISVVMGPLQGLVRARLALQRIFPIQILLPFPRFKLLPNFIYERYRPQTWQISLYFPALFISGTYKVRVQHFRSLAVMKEDREV